MDLKLFLRKVANEKSKKKSYCLYLNEDLINEFREIVKKQGNGWSLSSVVEAIVRQIVDEHKNDSTK